MGLVSAAVVANATENTVNMEEVQAQFIFDSFVYARDLGNGIKTGMEPLVIKNDNARINNGTAILIEVHGVYSEKIAEKAVFMLKDTGKLSSDTITEMIKDKAGMVKAIRFIVPSIRMRYKVSG